MKKYLVVVESACIGDYSSSIFIVNANNAQNACEKALSERKFYDPAVSVYDLEKLSKDEYKIRQNCENDKINKNCIDIDVIQWDYIRY